MAGSRFNGREMGDNARVTLRERLQTAVQSIQWTYTVFWKLSPQQGELVWADGYYNGSVKTRKTIIVRERSPEEHGLQRSDQLRELFESLSASGDGSQSSTVARRPTAALSPEDLTDTEWFYLVCMSCTFDPGTGIPGQAFAKGRPVWLCKANEASTKVFSRALLAKTACIQTVVCIPLAEGVLELGSTDLVREDTSIVQHVVSFFVERAKPTISEQSISSSQSGENGHEELQPALHAQQPKQAENAQQGSHAEQLQTRSAFCHWRIPEMQARQTPSCQQAMLKNVLLRVPHMYAKLKDQDAETNRKPAENGGDAQSKSAVRKDDDVNTAHAMLERRRREKLNERFMMLRNIVPFVTKMDKASILGDTIEYLKQLKKRVAELEQYNKRLEAGIRGQDMESSLIEADKAVTTAPNGENFLSLGMDMAIDGDIEAGDASPEDSLPTTSTTGREREQACSDIQVSQDMGSLDIQCASRKGILLDILMTLSELNLDVPAVQASTAERSFRATLKTEVKNLSTMVRPSVEDVEDALQRVTQSKAASGL